MPVEKARTLNDIVDRLRSFPSLVAVVLGGSYARGFARSESDSDIGLYYREAAAGLRGRVIDLAVARNC